MQTILDGCAPTSSGTRAGRAKISRSSDRGTGSTASSRSSRTSPENNQFSLFEPRDFFANGDKVVVTGHYTMTQKKTGKPVDSDWAHIFTFKGGKLTGWRELNDSTAFYKAYR